MTDELAPGLHELALAIVCDALDNLTSKAPPWDEPTEPKKLKAWKKKWADYFHGRRRDIAWFRDPEASAKWIEAAGYRYFVMVDDMDRRGLLELPHPDDLPPGVTVYTRRASRRQKGGGSE